MVIKNKNIIKSFGFTMVEVVIACSIISVLVLGLMKATERGIVMSNFTLSESQAIFLIEEGAESVKSIRDDSWTNISDLTLNTPYYLSFNNTTNKWELLTTPNVVDNFTRTVIFDSVSRDSNDDIITAGGVVDDGTKKVTIDVSWKSSGKTVNKSLSFYLADIFD